MQDTPTKVRTRSAPVQGRSEEAKIEEIFFDRTSRCYSCGKGVRSSKGLKFRPINPKEGLFICSMCDPLHVEKPQQIMQGRVRTIRPDHLEPEDAVCDICKRDIIDESKIQRRLKKLTASGQINSKDFQRLEIQERQRGWQYLSNNIYVHLRCKNGG